MPMIESALQSGYENEQTTSYVVEARPIQKSRPPHILWNGRDSPEFAEHDASVL